MVQSKHEIKFETQRHSEFFRETFSKFKTARTVKPRGQLIKEIENFSYYVPKGVKFQSFKSRKFNLNYVKDEFKWYLRGDKFDLSICKKAKMWGEIVNSDGSINSNYGQYIFGEQNQFKDVVRTLGHDKDSRRATIVILNHEHLISDTHDVPCTYSLNFRIRNDHLNMSVNMRSQDAIFGMGNDMPAFSFIHDMMLNALKLTYPDLLMGSYHHHCDSFHVYERHWNLIDKIVDQGDEYTYIDCPMISSPDEVDSLINFDNAPNEEFKFKHWLFDEGK